MDYISQLATDIRYIKGEHNAPADAISRDFIAVTSPLETRIVPTTQHQTSIISTPIVIVTGEGVAVVVTLAKHKKTCGS